MDINDMQDDSGAQEKAQQQRPQSQKESNTPTIDSFGRDITKLAAEGKLDKVVGREDEVERLLQILGRRKKNNPVLIGHPGCVLGNTKIIVRKVSSEHSHKINIID